MRDGRPSLLYVATVPAPLRNFYVPYARHLRAAGWRVSAAANGATLVPALREAFDEVHDIPFSRSIRAVRAHARSALEARRLIGAGYDIVHVHTPIAAFVVRSAVRSRPPETRPRLAYSAHGFHFFEGGNALINFVYRTAERVAGRWTDRLVVINEEDWLAARHAHIVSQRHLVRTPGVGVDTEWYSPSAVPAESQAAVRSGLGIDLEAPVFLVVGELHPNKRQGDAIAALARMRNRAAHLVLVGEGPQRASLVRQARELRVESRVHMPGFVEDPRPFVATSAGVVVASEREGLSRSIMEALAMEVPVVATTARGNGELVGDDAGLIVRIGDVCGLAAGMDSLIDDPEAARRMGLAGRARMVAEYEQEPIIRRHEQIYLSMLEEAGHPRQHRGRGLRPEGSKA